jgi:hypothetical protein
MRGSTHEAKIHVKFFAVVFHVDGQSLSSLLPDASLSMKIDEPEGVILENIGYTQNIPREHIQLVLTRATQVKAPDLGLQLMFLKDRFVF